MALVIQLFSYVLWFPLKILGIAAVLRVGVRRYPLIFAYMVATFLFAAAELPASLFYHGAGHHTNKDLYLVIHWYEEGLTYILILAVVISFIYRATARLLPRRIIRMVLAAGGLLFIVVSFLIHYDRSLPLGDWVTPWTRDLNVCAAILDLTLWGLLLGAREKDSSLLLLTGGMGISFTGEAIGTSIQSLARIQKSLTIFYVGHVFMMVADAVFLYIWWQTFRKEANRSKQAVAARQPVFGDRYAHGTNGPPGK
jgi:hypothetical protein